MLLAERRRPGPWYLRVRILLLGCVLGLLLPLLNPLLAGVGGNIAWLVDLATHWQWLYFAGLVVCVFAAMRVNRYWAPLLALAVLPWLTASPVAPLATEGPSLSVASANLHLNTTRINQLASWLAVEKPDLVVLLEVSPRLAKELEALQSYPFQVIRSEASPFGIALLSRLPLASSAIVADDDGIAHIEADVRFAGGLVGVRAFHPMPQLSAAFHQARDRKLRALIAPEQGRQVPQLIAGDFNASPWSSAMQGLEARGWRRASGLRPTWPTWGQGVLGIPIDQVLVSSAWGVEQEVLGPDLGSDHLPVMVRLRLQRSL